MAYINLDYKELVSFCEKVFARYGFSEDERCTVTDVLLDADLKGIESHGVQRLVRYDDEIRTGVIKPDRKNEIVFETPVSAVIDAHSGMGQLTAKNAMELAIRKAKTVGCGMVSVRNGNHYGIAGYYSEMAAKEDLIGICMTNTEAIMVPTYGKEPMLGTNPIALAMPAEPFMFSFDCATTIVPRGKFEVYAKRQLPVPIGWGVDEEGRDCDDTVRILNNIIEKKGGGILPLGGAHEDNGGHKGYGLGMLCEIFTGILSGGLTSDRVNRGLSEGNGICQYFMAIDYGVFGNKAAIKEEFSEYLSRIRSSSKAEGAPRIYTHGEKEVEMRKIRMEGGIPVNEKTLSEMKRIGADVGFFPKTVEG